MQTSTTDRLEISVPRRLYTLTAAAAAIGRSERQLRRLIERGLVAVIHLPNGRVGVTPAEVAKLRRKLRPAFMQAGY
jgi:hypothetical protein